MNEATKNESADAVAGQVQRLVRCHHAELVITETGDWTTEHSREGGEWRHANEPGGYSQRLDVRCCDCGYQATHWKGEKNKPRWLRDALDELGI